VTAYAIPFNRVSPVGRELEYMQLAISRGHVSGNGPFTRACEQLLERELGVARALLTTSCTHALEMMALLLDIGPGDEVILPAFTFVSTANAFVLRGARPVFVDIREDTLNLDHELVAAAITRRTKAICAVHYAGVACEMDALAAIASRHDIPVLEDAAHALFGRYRGRWLGTFGRLSALSFHETKNFSCGEGGALLINDSTLVERAEIVREKGTDRSRFLRGEVDKYSWVDVGSSYVMSDLLAAFLLGQLEARDHVQRCRRTVFDEYEASVGPWARRHRIGALVQPPWCEHPSHMYYLRLSDADARAQFIDALRAAGILAVSHYVPLHLSDMGRRYGYQPADLPVTERVSREIVRLPFYTSMTVEEQHVVTDTIARLDTRVFQGIDG
jgi:dTDP-4-amino-4,6-dideoxygalactose transaminase